MTYNEAFFTAYEKYLDEPIVRRNHDRAFAMFSRLLPSNLDPRVIDLGCGLSEYEEYGRYSDYIGVDKFFAPQLLRRGVQLVQADYMDTGAFGRVLHDFGPDMFVSLFSVEACYSRSACYTLYNELFALPGRFNFGLVSGFYYKDSRDHATVVESGGIVSYQTNDVWPDDKISIPGVTEYRLYMETPSEMFGPEVVEVWKMFVRDDWWV